MKRPRLRTRRGVFLLPALFTVANIFLGFFSIIQSLEGEFAAAALAIGFAILADLMDGRVARFAEATSEFGRELDSLADMTSFGVAPAVLAFTWVLHRWPQTGWLVAALFVVCAAVRLARFNVGRLSVDPRFYFGMSSPAAAAVVGAVVYWHPEPPESRLAAAACLFGLLAVALLMNSPVRYLSFKGLAGRQPQSYRTLVVVAVFVVAAIAEPVVMFLFLAGAYAVSRSSAPSAGPADGLGVPRREWPRPGRQGSLRREPRRRTPRRILPAARGQSRASTGTGEAPG